MIYSSPELYISAFICICSVLLDMQTRLQDFTSFSAGLLGDLDISEQQQNKVSMSFFYDFQIFLFY